MVAIIFSSTVKIVFLGGAFFGLNILTLLSWQFKHKSDLMWPLTTFKVKLDIWKIGVVTMLSFKKSFDKILDKKDIFKIKSGLMWPSMTLEVINLFIKNIYLQLKHSCKVSVRLDFIGKRYRRSLFLDIKMTLCNLQ